MPKIGGLYSGLYYTFSNLNIDDNMENLDELIELATLANKSDSIVSIFAMPTHFISTNSDKEERHKSDTIPYPKTIFGYKPKNNKLLCYPYTFLNVDCLCDNKNYRYEWFSVYRDLDEHPSTPPDDDVVFWLDCAMTPNPEITITPLLYNGIGPNATEQLIMSGFPQLSWREDAFKAYLAQKSASDVLGLTSALLGVSYGVGMFASATNPLTFAAGIGLISSNTGNAASTLINSIHSATKGSRARGSSGGGTNIATGLQKVYYKEMGVTREEAVIIDEYFDRYGYSCCRNKVPNRKARKHWTYTKTVGCNIDGNLPIDALKKIRKIYDSGITFWTNGDLIGEYGLNNTPENE